MDLIDRLKTLGDRISKLKNQVETEQATKNAFVMPFLSALGYDVFNPLEIIPEFVADIGIKKGEKVDYCILKDGKPIIIIECKHWKEKMDLHGSQLFRYFHVTNARFSILTNGICYRFYTDLEAPNKMDDKPFFEFSMENISEAVATELKKFQKDNFDIEQILHTASDLKYSSAIREVLANELKSPGEDFVRFFASRVYTGRITAKVVEQFTDLVQRSAKTLISEMISERLELALKNEKEDRKQITVAPKDSEQSTVEGNDGSAENGILTTEEELEAFRIVRAILRREVEVNRITLRDTKSYLGILLDDNNRKPVCRFWFNRSQKYISLFDQERNEERVPIERLEDIYTYADRLVKTLQMYEGATTEKADTMPAA